jgi:hypothetical protein
VRRSPQRRLIQKRVDLLAPGLGVGLSEVHQASGVIRLEHDQAQGVRALGLASAETAGGEAKGARQPRLEVGCEAPEVFGRAQDEGFDRVQIGAWGAGDRTRGNGVEPLDAQGILVKEVEEDGVQELAEDLGGWWVAANRGTVGLLLAAIVAGGDGEDAPGPELEGRRERRRKADAAVAAPAPAALDCMDSARKVF